MRDKWLRFGCFLTGYNYSIVRGCSESASRRVLRYTSAMLIICVLWGLVGFSFSQQYLNASVTVASLVSVVMIFLVVQVERQVILAQRGKMLPLLFRGLVAVAMAIIGSLIIDQRIFKEDIEKRKVLLMNDEIEAVLPKKAHELKRQIGEIDSTILQKEYDRKLLIEDISRNPKITIYSSHVTRGISKADSVPSEVRVRSSQQIPNPKMEFLQPLDEQINGLRKQKMAKDSMLLSLRPMVENELRAHVGFLDELNVLINIVSNSWPALFVWCVWLVLLFGLEIFILVSKTSEQENDYDKVLEQQKAIHLKRIELLATQ